MQRKNLKLDSEKRRLIICLQIASYACCKRTIMSHMAFAELKFAGMISTAGMVTSVWSGCLIP